MVDISFIIIGRNEGWKLPKCIESVLSTIKYNSLIEYEIIYVDSKSTDNSIENVKKYKEIKIFKLTEDFNAAIARNIGAKESKGKVLFFIDGDMEIDPSFLPIVYNTENGLINNFVSGNWVNYYYNIDGALIKTDSFKNLKKDTIEKVTGGLFLIKKNIWEKVKGMNPKFKKSEDIDFGLRLAKKNIYLIRKKEIAAKHHSVEYLDQNRKWKDFFKWHHLYGKSLLYRKHLLNYNVYHRIIRHDYSMLALVLFTGISIINPIFSYLFILYFLLLFYRSKYNFGNLQYYFLRDLSTIIGFFIFYPKKLKSSYIKIT